MTLQDTASKTDTLLQCARPFEEGVETEDPPGESAKFGTAWHLALADILRSWAGVTVTRSQLDTWAATGELHGLPGPHVLPSVEAAIHAAASFTALQKWVLGGNPWGATYRVETVERPLATKLVRVREEGRKERRVRTRAASFDPDAHRYDLRPGEFGGTADLVLVRTPVSPPGPHRIVVDHKSGLHGVEKFGQPASMGQMLTLALMTSANAVAILHHPQGGVPLIYSEELSTEVIQAFARKRMAAARRAGDGSLRVGSECAHCPARGSCPAKTGEVVLSTSALVRSVTAAPLAEGVDKGKFHLLLSQLDKLVTRARQELREAVRAGEVIERPDGRVLTLETRSYESLSKASVVAALGPVEGPKMLERLRKLGALTTQEREELHAR